MAMDAGLIFEALTIIVLIALFIRAGHLVKAVEKISEKSDKQ